MPEVKRIFVGGLVENITDKEICERFNRFGDVTDVDIRSKNELLSGEKKIFAYINLKTTDEKLDKCIKIYNNSKWKGKQLQVQVAKENFLQRLQKERHMDPGDEPKEKSKLHSDDHSKIKETVIKATPQGTPVDNMRNWVVAKQGKILPVMYIRRKDKKKVVKVDPSKYIHRNKTLDDETGSSGIDPADIPVDSLTWWQEEKTQKSASKTVNGSKNTLTKTQSDSQLKDDEKNYVANSNSKKSGYFKNKAITYCTQQDNGTVNFYSDSDCDEAEQVSAPDCCSSSEDTDEVLSKLKINNKHVKSQSKIKLERTQAQSKKTKPEPIDYSSNDDTSEGSDLIAGGHVGSLPKWLESESESDFDSQTTAVSGYAKTLAGKNIMTNEKQQPNSMTTTNHLNQSPTKKTRSDSVEEQKPVRHTVAMDRQAGNSPKIQTKDVTKQYDKVRKGSMKKTAKHFEYVPGILDEYSSGLQEQHSDHSSNDDDGDDEDDELDVFDMIQSGKINKLYKQSKTKATVIGKTAENQLIKANDLKTKKHVLDPSTERRSELDKCQQDKTATDIGTNKLGELTGIRSTAIQHAPKQMKQSKRKTIDSPTELKSDNEKSNKKLKVLCSAELSAKVNEKRLSSLKERLMAAQQQKAVVKQALAVVDSQQQTSKKIIFDSDEEQEIQIQKDQATRPGDRGNQSESDLKQMESVKKKAPMLFDSDSSDSPHDEDITDDESDKERFNIRPEFEGRAGKRLLQLQSRYGNDSRFKLDTRFIESSSSSDSDADEESTVQNKDDAASEKYRALDILRSLVGHKATEGRKKEKTFKDINTLHYDPASTTHSEFEIPIKKTKKKISNIKKEPEVEKEEEKEDKPDMPEVSTERFYEVKQSLKDLFRSKDNEDKPFSLAATFGHVSEDEEVNEVQDDNTRESLSAHRNTVPWQNLLTDKDSSYEHDDDDDEDKETTQNKRSSLGEHLSDVNTRNQSRFFLRLSDDDVQESLKFFTSPEDKSEMRAKWLEARPGLVEAYKMKRRRSLRETHTKQRVNKRGRRR